MPRQASWELYTIQPGDTLSHLARRFGSSVSALAAVNGIKNPDLIQAGATLQVRRYYTVVDGDTLNWIARDFGASLEELLAVNTAADNAIANPDQIVPGQRIYLPGTEGEAEGAPAQPPAAAAQAATWSSNKYAGEAAAYDDDLVPGHRRAPGPSLLQIGDVQFVVPPSFIEVNTVSRSKTIPGLRRNAIRTDTGYSETEIKIDLWFLGREQINGLPVANPEGGQYYMDGLRALIAQFRKCPILPVGNVHLNEVHQIYAVTLSNLIVTTVEGFPGTLKATLILHKTTVQPYLAQPDPAFGDMICWPVFRWYYQQLVTDGPRAGRTYLEPIRTPYLTGSLRFFVPEEGFLADYHEPADLRGEIDDQMLEVPLGDFSITDMTVALENQFATVQNQAMSCPSHQFLSAMDTTFVLSLRCGEETMKDLTQLKNVTDDFSVRFRDRCSAGFARIENELAQLFGVRHVLIAGLTARTVEGLPGHHDVQMKLVSFDRNERRWERPDDVTMAQGSPDDAETVFKGDWSHVEHTLRVEEQLNTLELYPDLELPTYQEARRALDRINEQRKRNGLRQLTFQIKPADPARHLQTESSEFVDPDFFMSYPGWLPGGIFYNDIRKADQGHEAIPDWVMQAGTDQTIPVGTFPGEAPTGEKLLTGCLHDMVRYGRRGLLVQAFPTYCLLFIEEGPWLDGRRVWTRYFAHHNLAGITVEKDRQDPVDRCKIVLANNYGTLDTPENAPAARAETEPPSGFWSTVQAAWRDMFPTLTREMMDYRARALGQAPIRPGLRVHLRMGYGSAASEMPVVFNGRVVEMGGGETIELIAQGDGAELLNTFTTFRSGEHTGFLLFGYQPENIISGMMTYRLPWGRIVGSVNESSPYGIEHFGQLKKQRFTDQFRNDAALGQYRRQQGSGVVAAGWWIYDQGDITGNIYASSAGTYLKSERTSLMDKVAGILNDTVVAKLRDMGVNVGPINTEVLVNVDLGSKRPWDVFSAVTSVTSDYVLGIHPHQFRSTLFFGLPQFPVRYGYGRAPGKSTGGDDPANYVRLQKPFTQVHIYTSLTDILQNNITASDQDLVHSCAAIYQGGGGSDLAPPVQADETIKADQIRSAVIDSTINHTLQAHGILKGGIDILGGVIEKVPPLADEVDSILKTLKALPQDVLDDLARDRATMAARTHVRDSFRQMYQGKLRVLGDPTVKPHDLVHLVDPFTQMFGTAAAGRVIHQMSPDLGFITEIKPDLLTGLTDSAYDRWLEEVAGQIAPLGLDVVRGHLLHYAEGVKNAYGWLKFGAAVYEALPELTEAIQKARKLWGFIRQAKTVANLVKELEGLKEIEAGGELLLTAAAPESGGTSLIGLLVWEIIWKLLDLAVYETEQHFINGNVIRIHPLWLRGMPFVAGVSGFRRIVTGMMDPWFYPDQTGPTPPGEQSLVGLNYERPLATAGKAVAAKAAVGKATAGEATAGKVGQRFAFPVTIGSAEGQAGVGDRFGSTEGRRTPHGGQDFYGQGGRAGQPVYATADGTVTQVHPYTDRTPGYEAYGTFVVIDHGGGIQSLYAHLETTRVAEGQHVSQGEPLGTMGGQADWVNFSCGYWYDEKGQKAPSSTGPHLHFEIRVNGQKVDPMTYLNGR